jgi:hypothetical protein
MYGEKDSPYSVLCGETKRPLGRPRRRWENNVKLDLREKELERELNITDVAQNGDRVQNSCEHMEFLCLAETTSASKDGIYYVYLNKFTFKNTANKMLQYIQNYSRNI